MFKNKVGNLKKKLALIICLLISVSLFSGCLKKPEAGPAPDNTRVELVYYKLFDGEDVIKPLIQQFQATNPNIVITYRKFDNEQDYYRTILNELAEGEGPDIFSVPNYWLQTNVKKLTPMPNDYYSPATFEETFVSVAAKDALLVDPADGVRKVYGLPMTVDSLALYYNKDLFEDRVPQRGRPGATWEEFKDDVFKLTKADNSFERFEVAGTAMGRSDNIARSLDILYTLMLQYKVKFYNDAYTQADFSKQQAADSTGASINPASKALELYTSFGLASQKNYSWNEFMADTKSPTKEIEAFARGKVATVFGYSYVYEQLQEQVDQLKKSGETAIDTSVIRVAPVPQVNDPSTSTVKRDAYANYFVETVSRNSANAEAAWRFLVFMSSKENQQYYNQKTHRPTSRRDLIEDQLKDPIYGVYAEQSGYAESLLVYDWDLFKEAFNQAVTDVLNTINPREAMRSAETKINAVLPTGGFIPKAEVLP
ncbi:MAG: ABC transporter substrate-binding protein [Candidatus Altimarinota bacterium]